LIVDLLAFFCPVYNNLLIPDRNGCLTIFEAVFAESDEDGAVFLVD
jgi:hypothetical protein